MWDESIKRSLDWYVESQPESKHLVDNKWTELYKNLEYSEITWDSELVQNLIDFRKTWKKGIDFYWVRKEEIRKINKNIDNELKEKIVTAANKISVNLEKDKDGSRLIKFKLWAKNYTILDVKIEKHTNNYYKYDYCWDEVVLWWMKSYDVNRWENKELKAYVKEKQREWFHMPKKEEIQLLLKELWKEADINTEYKVRRRGRPTPTKISPESNQIAMLMYLTGMDWKYWLDREKTRSGNRVSRDYLHFAFGDKCREFGYWDCAFNPAKIWMISCD